MPTPGRQRSIAVKCHIEQCERYPVDWHYSLAEQSVAGGVQACLAIPSAGYLSVIIALISVKQNRKHEIDSETHSHFVSNKKYYLFLIEKLGVISFSMFPVNMAKRVAAISRHNRWSMDLDRTKLGFNYQNRGWSYLQPGLFHSCIKLVI